jgi:branched-chain amino acid transport system permease protein
MTQKNKLIIFALCALGLIALPHILQIFGDAWVRIAGLSLLYTMLALGLNIVVGYAGLLDLGYVAFFAVGAYMYGLLASPQLTSNFPAIAAMFPGGLHISIWLAVPLALVVAAAVGVLLGIPVLKLRGDYLAIVTLGFGEIIRIFMNNLDHPSNITNGPKGIIQIDPIRIFGFDMGQPVHIGGY